MSWESRSYWLRAVGLWFFLMLAETLHGLWRVKVLDLWTGDAAARDISVFTGSLVILLITLACIGLIAARSARTLVLVGFTWMVLTIAYELALARFVFHLSWAEIASDFNLSQGSLLPIGLLFLMFSSLLATRLRRQLTEPAPRVVGPRCEGRHTGP
jgi:hypothetical protein